LEQIQFSPDLQFLVNFNLAVASLMLAEVEPEIQKAYMYLLKARNQAPYSSSFVNIPKFTQSCEVLQKYITKFATKA